MAKLTAHDRQVRDDKKVAAALDKAVNATDRVINMDCIDTFDIMLLKEISNMLRSVRRVYRKDDAKS